MKLVRLLRLLRSQCVVPTALLLFAGCSSGKSGTQGSDGQPGAPGVAATVPEPPKPEVAINLVEPRVGLLARTVDVTISTSGKLDLSKATVSFGDGINVVKTVQQGNALVASIEIDPEATLGKRDVVLEAGGEKLTAKGGFVVAVHLDAKVGAGKAEQGGLVRLDISNRDKVAFDPERFTLFALADQKDPSLVGLKYESFTATDGSV
ncbi:MAG TPA: hypothetical protein VM925_25975, partial [Labilithrix sp.]|nr:hypothetical protein [Labilithrix sp.]